MCLTLILGCKHQKAKPVSHISTISIQESACEGQCPVYHFTISNDGNAVFKGNLNVAKVGEFQFHYSKEEIAGLFQLISNTNFSNFDDVYESFVADLPETIVTYNNQHIVIKDIGKIPSELKNIVLELRRLAKLGGYIY